MSDRPVSSREVAEAWAERGAYLKRDILTGDKTRAKLPISRPVALSISNAAFSPDDMIPFVEIRRDHCFHAIEDWYARPVILIYCLKPRIVLEEYLGDRL